MSYKDKAALKVTYEGADITVDILPYLMSFTYRDKVSGESDELTLQLRDNAHLWKWAWMPKSGDKIEADIIQGNTGLPCGKFEVTEVSFTGSTDSGHTCTITALSAGVLAPHKTKTSWAHEGTTLKAIAEHYAKKYHWKVQGIIHNYSIARVTQFNESDLGFLHRLAEEYGYALTLKGETLVFTYMEDMNNAAGTIKVKRDELISYSIRDKTVGIYVKGQNRYYNPKKKKLIENSVDGGGKGADTYRTHSKADNDAQGLQWVGGRLYKKNMEQTQVDATMPGNIYIMAGNNVNLEGFFNFNGVYMISEANHSVTPDGGYITSAVFKNIVPNKGTGGGGSKAKETGMNKPDFKKYVTPIYQALQRILDAVATAKANNKVVSADILQKENRLIVSYIGSLKCDGADGAVEAAEDIQGRYDPITVEFISFPGDAISDTKSLQSYLNSTYMDSADTNF